MPSLRPFQREDVEFLKQNGLRALIANAPGTGKTATSIRALVESKGTFPAVIVCPASVTRNWAKEVRKWAKGVKTVIIDDMDSPVPKRTGAPTFYIVSWALLDARWADLTQLNVRSVIADEAHYAKSASTLRSQALHRLSTKAAHFMLLSGTPIINTRAELEVLNDLLGSQNPPMLRRLLEDVAPDIPPKSRSYLHVRLRDKHQEEYDKANQDFENWLRVRKERLLGEGMADIEVERTLAAEALAKIGYLRRLVGEAKVPACADFIARAVRLGEPVVVFVEHQAALERLSHTLRKQRIRHEVLDGSVSPKKRQEIVEGFQRYDFPVFIGTRAAKEGITLTAARHLVFLERFFTSADEEQAEDRIRRIGQKHPTTIWFLHAHGTIDDRVDTIVRGKRHLIRTAIGAAEIMETSTSNVEELISHWQDFVSEDEVEFSGLGLGDPLPALPSSRDTHAIVFYGDRWNDQNALLWCRMNGFVPTQKTALNDRFKLVVHPTSVFHKNRFKMFSVSKDIKVIQGERLSKANERRVRNSLRGVGS
jgi:SWI/SNF-related matrix-associated actin-dependent regulator 1 of chromatin subfamily A